jgi:methylated-DNA-protein-cysteine methyltransferase-like protein
VTPWLRSVERVVKAIPPGKTASYGQVAMLAGRPGGARAVVRALQVLEGLPWWRVIRSDGSLAEQVRAEQGRRLRAEGVAVKGAGTVPASARLGLE